MMHTEMDDTGVRMRLWGEKLVIIVSKDRAEKAREIAAPSGERRSSGVPGRSCCSS